MAKGTLARYCDICRCTVAEPHWHNFNITVPIDWKARAEAAEANLARAREIMKPGGDWRVVPAEPTAEIVAAIAINTSLPIADDFAVAVKALKLLPPTDHPDRRIILAEIARDYRQAMSAAPLPPEQGDGNG